MHPRLCVRLRLSNALGQCEHFEQTGRTGRELLMWKNVAFFQTRVQSIIPKRAYKPAVTNSKSCKYQRKWMMLLDTQSWNPVRVVENQRRSVDEQSKTAGPQLATWPSLLLFYPHHDVFYKCGECVRNVNHQLTIEIPIWNTAGYIKWWDLKGMNHLETGAGFLPSICIAKYRIMEVHGILSFCCSSMI